MGLVADNLPPLLWVIVALGHDHAHLFCPVRAQLEDSLVDLHSDGAGVGHDHGLAREQIGSVVLVVVQDVIHQGGDGLVIPQDGLHLAQFLFALFDHIGIGVLGHQVILGVNEPQGVLVQLQVDDSALIVNRAGSTILHRLGHVVDVDIVAEHLSGAAVLGGNRSAGKADVCSVG